MQKKQLRYFKNIAALKHPNRPIPICLTVTHRTKASLYTREPWALPRQLTKLEFDKMLIL